jgi:serine/threonine protein kinase
MQRFMSIDPGTRLGPNEVTGSLGAGGMGEVYLARDTKLNRDVALEILPESFASDADRQMRFTTSATTSSRRAARGRPLY